MFTKLCILAIACSFTLAEDEILVKLSIKTGFHIRFLAALAALYLHLVVVVITDSLPLQNLRRKSDTGHLERLETLQTFDQDQKKANRSKEKKKKKTNRQSPPKNGQMNKQTNRRKTIRGQTNRQIDESTNRQIKEETKR